MPFYQWINNHLPHIVEDLDSCIEQKTDMENRGHMGMAGRDAIFQVLDNLLAILFPGCFGKEFLTRDEVRFFLQDKIRQVSLHFLKQLKFAYRYEYSEEEAARQAEKTLIHLIEQLPQIRNILEKDIVSASEGDPAAHSLDEIILSYPFIEAVATHRIAHILYAEKVPIIPWLMSERAHSHTGIINQDINPTR